MVLPWVPATATTRRPAITDAEPGRARQHPQAPRCGPPATSGLSSRTAVETTTVSALAERARRRGRGGTRDAELAQRVAGSASPVVAAAHGQPARDHDPRDRGQPGAADADEVHAPELGRRAAARRGRAGAAGSPAGPPTASTIRASLSSASRGTSAAAAAPIAGEPVGVGHQRRDVVGDPVGREVGVGDEQRAPGVDDRPRVVLLLAVADREAARRSPAARPRPPR